VPPRDLSVVDIAPLNTIGFYDSSAYGAKAANLAELWKTLPPGFVPGGFAVPFHFYDVFMRENGYYDVARQFMADPQFQADPGVRRETLKAFRKTMRKEGILPEWMRSALDAQHHQRRYGGGASLRCRSSTNNEDLPNFSGAGLYDSYTQHPHEGHIEKSMKQVWSSLWNYRAFEERDFHRIDHFAAAMGVLVHRNYANEQVNGVAVTKNIFDINWRGYYINSQLGEDLVTNPDAASVPEELLVADLLGEERYEIQYIRFSNAIPVGEHLLTKTQIFELADHMNLIQDRFRWLYQSTDPGFAMDIEFKIREDGRLAIKQARPWIN
jgi:phosphoenolpyruvate synthase/pyruvate phosphate dikinase